MGDYLAGKLKDAVPFFVRESRSLFQRVDVGDRSVLAKCEDQQVVQLFCERGPLSQDDTGTRPRSFTQIMGVLFLLRTIQGIHGETRILVGSAGAIKGRNGHLPEL